MTPERCCYTREKRFRITHEAWRVKQAWLLFIVSEDNVEASMKANIHQSINRYLLSDYYGSHPVPSADKKAKLKE